ncbi:MAG: ABC transporter permease subunit [Eggerthellaceae bacterium]|nr:ABC transporter permease subunit [Eggerthellaceae bacterium]
MPDLIRFELKKIVTRKTTLVTCVVVFAIVCGVMGLNILQADYSTPSGNKFSGLAAIEQERAAVSEHACTLTPERIADEIAAYQELAFSKAAPEELASMSDSAAYQLMRERCTDEEFDALYNPLARYLLAAWSASPGEPYQTAARMALAGTDPATFYDRLAERTQSTVATGLDPAAEANMHFTQPEGDLWLAKQTEVSAAAPLEYGYAGGWEDILNCAAFLIFPLIAICIALAPVFSAEYAERTDALLLAARHGRTKLVAAKLAASGLFAVAYFTLCAAVIVAVPLACYGAGGADLPVQLFSSKSPCALTMTQATAVAIGLGYAFMLGVGGLTLLLSSKLRSQVAVFAVGVLLMLGPVFVGTGGNEVLVRVLYLFPVNALNPTPLFWSFVSYGVGPVALDVAGMVLVVWLALALISTPLSARSWRRHQVV